ncbi:hypothetical protein [Zobellella maritima]|uniref:hypothetical protein n=1 Tax=Zobellella maritima TaxID=2059725 RepID=UPI000E306068|nr:hypothetical protein [Zobellella maritima]
MVGAGLNCRSAGRRAGLTLILVLMVLSICLSQRMGLQLACPATGGTLSAEQLAESLTGDEAEQPTPGQPCDLSGKLLFKNWSLQDIPLIGLLLLLVLWLLLPPRYFFHFPSPLRFATRRRRHLLFCVFRE